MTRKSALCLLVMAAEVLSPIPHRSVTTETVGKNNGNGNEKKRKQHGQGQGNGNSSNDRKSRGPQPEKRRKRLNELFPDADNHCINCRSKNLKKGDDECKKISWDT